MADVKISALPAATTPLAGTEVLPIVQSSTTKKVAISDVTAGRAISASSLTLTTPLAVGSGGTGLTSLTAGYIPYASSSSALSFSSNLYSTGTNIGINTSSPNVNLQVGDGTGARILAIDGGTSTAQGGAFAVRQNGSYQGIFGTAALIIGSGTNADFLVQSYNNNITLQTVAAGTYISFNVAGSGAEKMRLDASGNLGLGVTPSAWKSNYRVLEIGRLGNGFWGQTDASGVFMSSNTYLNSSTQFIYANTAAATYYTQNSGQHQWFNAASGTAGTAITFTQAMTLDASGQLGVGTSSPGYKLHVAQASAADVSATFEAQTAGYAVNLLLAGNNAGGSRFNNIQSKYGATQQWYIGGAGNDATLVIQTGGTERARIDSSGNVVINTAAIATTATDGFLYVPTCAGTPTGTPTTYTGRAPIVVDTTNNKLYFYSTGVWRDAGP